MHGCKRKKCLTKCVSKGIGDAGEVVWWSVQWEEMIEGVYSVCTKLLRVIYLWR